MPIKDSALPTRAARDRAGHAQHHHCLVHDLGVLSTAAAARRRALGMIAGAGTLALFGCGGAGDSGSAAADATTETATMDFTSTPSTGTTTSASASCSVIREETEGPYPADGSNRADGSVANALMLSGIVRSDIRGSIAGATGVAAGVPLTLAIELVNTNSACADLAGYAIYVRHCDREGRYSLYSAGVIGENYLRGVQVTGSDTATFTTVFPGCTRDACLTSTSRSIATRTRRRRSRTS
jgi:hypothetical protein